MPDKVTKFIASLESKLRLRLIKKMEQIIADPSRTSGVKKLKGFDHRYRVRVGQIRIVYDVKDHLVEIVDVDYRGNVY